MSRYPEAEPGDPATPPPLSLDMRDTRERPVVINRGVPGWAVAIITVCVAVLTCILGFAAGFVTGVSAAMFENIEEFASVTLENVELTVVAPEKVGTGEKFLIVATITNDDDVAHTIDMVDIYTTVLEGVSAKSSDPAWTETFVTDDYTSYYYPNSIAPGESLTITFTMVAGDEAGEFAGDFDVWFEESGSYVTWPFEVTIE